MPKFLVTTRPNHFRVKRIKKSLIRRLLTRSKEMEINSTNLPISGLLLATEKKVPIFVKCIFALTLCVCISFFLYQTYVRTNYYLEYQTAVDVIQTSDEFEHPAFFIVGYDSAAMIYIWNRSGLISPPGNLVNYDCINPLLSLLKQSDVIPHDITMKEVWDASNFTTSLMSYKIFTKQKSSDLAVIQVSKQTSLGIILVFQFISPWMPSYEGSSLEIKFKKVDIDFCPEHSYLINMQQEKDGRTIKSAYPMNAGSERKLSFYYNKYVYVNTPKSRCVSVKENAECYSDCFDKKLAQLDCKFPFAKFKNNIPLPECKIDSKIGENYQKLLYLYYTTDEETDCHCIKKCEEYAFEPVLESTASSSEAIAVFKFHFLGREVTAYIQRLAFDQIALLSEIGGTLGLTTGLSLLSLMQCVITIVKMIHGRQKRFRSTTGELHLLKKINKIRKNLNKSIGKSSLNNAIKIIIVICFIGLTIYMLHNRINHFLNEPVRVAVEIIRNSIVQFPTVTVCGQSTKIFKLKKKANNNNATGCENINPLELINSKNTANSIWDALSVDQAIHFSNTAEMYTGFSTKFNVSKSTRNLLFGKCTQVKTEPILYQGAVTVFILDMIPFQKFIFCDNHLIWYLLHPPDEEIDLTTARTLIGGTRDNAYIRIKKVTVLNTSYKTCVDKKIHQQCKEECLNKELQQQLPCRLPYMNENDFNISMCTDTDSAVKSQKKYVEIYMRSEAFPHCHCLPSCTKTIITFSMVSDEHKNVEITILTQILVTNYIEHFSEVRIYTGHSLISDIGSIISIGLGLSILTVFDTVSAYWSK